MIIYQAQPNKCFPPLTKELVRELKVPFCEFGIHLESTDKQKAYSLHNHGLDQKKFWLAPEEFKDQELPYSLKTPRMHNGQELGLVYGLFDEWRIDYQPKDFVFTFISHPVSRVYDLFYFCKRYLDKESCFGNFGLEIFQFIDSHFQFPDSLEEFIDKFIAVKGDFSLNNFRLSNNMLRQQKSFENYSFIGIVEKTEESIDKLNSLLNIKIKVTEEFVSEPPQENYRISDLEKLLAEDILVYESFLKKI